MAVQSLTSIFVVWLCASTQPDRYRIQQMQLPSDQIGELIKRNIRPLILRRRAEDVEVSQPQPVTDDVAVCREMLV